MIKKTSTDWKK